MQQWTFRKRLRRVHRLLVDSRTALERASASMSNKLLNDLLFMMACQRIIMLNMLDRELGTLGRAFLPGRDAAARFAPYFTPNKGPHTIGLMSACEQEEDYLKQEIGELMKQPGLTGHTRNTLAGLMGEVEEDLRDLKFAQSSMSAA